MQFKKRVIIIFLIFLIIATNYLLAIRAYNQNGKKTYLDQQTEKFENSYQTIKRSFISMADVFFRQFVQNHEVVKLFSQAELANEKRSTEIRDSIYFMLTPGYEYLKTKNIRQLHFHLPNNESFLRFHRPQKYGDNLTDIRYSVKMANKTGKIYSGFEEGRIFNGFRHVFPLYSGTKQIGTVEASFSFGAIKQELVAQEFHQAGFMVKKDIVENKVFENELANYIPSLLSDDYFHEADFLHYKKNSENIFKQIDVEIKKEVENRINNNQNFTIYHRINGENYLISFVSINNVEGKPAAYIFGYKKDDFLQHVDRQTAFMQILGVFLLAIIAFLFLLVTQINSKIKDKNKELAEKEEKFRTVADFNHDWEYWRDQNNKFLYISPSAERITGYTPKEFYADNNLMKKIIHPDDFELFMHHKHSINEKGERNFVEFRIVTKNGEIEWIGHQCQNVFDKEGKNLGIRGSNRIITKQKETQIKLQQAVATKNKFFNIIAHDLRSPFNAILGFSEILLERHDKYDAEKRRQMIIPIKDSAEKTYTLLNNLLEWSRMQTGKFRFQPEKNELFIITYEALSGLEEVAKSKNIELKNEIKNNTPVFVDNEMIKTVIRNLVSNAIKFTSKGGKITVSAEKREYETVVFVKDTGVGMPQEKIGKLFDITQKTNTYGTENESGTGLGLLLCKEFVEKHNGKIWIESKINEGSVFYFSIPQKK